MLLSLLCILGLHSCTVNGLFEQKQLPSSLPCTLLQELQKNKDAQTLIHK